MIFKAKSNTRNALGKIKPKIFKFSFLPFSTNWLTCFCLTIIILTVFHQIALAQSPDLETVTPVDSATISLTQLQGFVNGGWVLIASILVIFMNAGFAMLEAGLCRQKNAVNVLSKNLIVFSIATLVYWAFGFALMFGKGNTLFGFSGFFLNHQDSATYGLEPFPLGLPLAVFFLFQVAFAGTSATIVSGAVAERITFKAFLMFSVFKVLSYSIVGHWAWGEGWLKDLGFIDFAGATIVHSAGGWAALVGAFLLKPRQDKYQKNGAIQALPGHNLSMATLGCFILWIGWFGFNGGSQQALDSQVFSIIVNTNLAAAAGSLMATFTSWVQYGKPDLSLIINGTLAGLVAITASCNDVSAVSAVAIGATAGVLVVFSIAFFDAIKIDDPVGAISVHLVNGIWGTLAVAIFTSHAGADQFTTQLIGVLAVGAFTILFSGLVWFALQLTMGIRVSAEAEREGLDISEHAMEAYSFASKSDAVTKLDQEER
jgi:ammonium transporter, Amt family